MRRCHWFALFFLATFAPFAMADMGTVGMTLLKSAAGALASGVVGSIFGGGKQAAPAAPAPAVEKPTVMPTPDDEAAQKAKKRSIVAQIQRQGRASTILTGDNEAMG